MKILLVLIFSFTSLLAMAADNAEELLKISDRSRGGIQSGVSWQATILTDENGSSSTRTFNVKAKGDDAFVESLSPARNKGEIFIFNNRNMWFYKPSLRKPVSISARQKLSGQAANGDIASTNYFRDYSATAAGTEQVGGENVQILMLKAKSNKVTYDQIKYWISTKSKLAIKAEFMTLKGKISKVASFEYDNSLTAGGSKFPFISKMIIQDAKFKENKSVIEYSKPKTESLADSLFNINNVNR